MPTSTLKIGAGGSLVSYDAPSRLPHRVIIDRLVLNCDEPWSLEFREFGKALPPTWKVGTAVEWDDDTGIPVFKGEITTVQPGFSPSEGWTFAYQCLDLKYAANRIPITSPIDNTGSIGFNLPSDDPDYVAALAGQSVGLILAYLFGGHSAALSAAGIAGYVAADLTPLTLVPPTPVTITGPAFFNAVDGFLSQWAGYYSCWVEYHAATSDWRIRVVDTTAFSPTTLTLGTDPIEPPSISRDASGCFSRVTIRGKSETEAAFCSTLDRTLTPAWTAAQQAAWKWSDWSDPGNAVDAGTVTAVGSTSVTVQSASGGRAWPVNFWSTNQGTIWLINPVATDITQQEQRKVTACSALTAGGTATVTLDRPLVNGGYTKYRLVCQPTDSNIDVWRRYNVTNAQAIGHVATRFNVPVTWANQGLVELVSYPIGAIDFGAIEFPGYFEVDAANSQVRFAEPVVKIGNSQANLDSGGSSVTPPTDVKALIPYSRGTLTATAPASGYSGTSYTADGLSRTWILDQPQWTNKGDVALYQALAAMLLATVQDTVIAGQVTYYGKLDAALTLGMSLNVAGHGYTTGWESIACPVRQVVLNWPQDGASPFVTTLTLNNRRRARTGEAYYIHPAFTGGAASEVQGGTIQMGQIAFAAGETGLLDAADEAAGDGSYFVGATDLPGPLPGRAQRNGWKPSGPSGLPISPAAGFTPLANMSEDELLDNIYGPESP